MGNSPARHRAVRKLREFYRLNKQLFPDNCQLFLLIRRPILDWNGFEGKVAGLMRRLDEERPKAEVGEGGQ